MLWEKGGADVLSKAVAVTVAVAVAVEWQDSWAELAMYVFWSVPRCLIASLSIRATPHAAVVVIGETETT